MTAEEFYGGLTDETATQNEETTTQEAPQEAQSDSANDGSQNTPQEASEREGETYTVTKEQMEYLERARHYDMAMAAANAVKSEHPDFDANYAFNALAEIGKKDPERMAALSNADGLKLIWLERKEKLRAAENNDRVDGGRGAEPFDEDKVAERINKGEADQRDLTDFYTELGRKALHGGN